MGVEYTGAQSLFNGISSAGNSLGQGLAQGIQNWKAGKAAAAAANATAKYIQANANQMGIDPEQVQQFTQQGPHESPIAYNTRLNQAIQNMMVGQKVKENQAAIALQGQQAAGLAASTAGQGITNQRSALDLQIEQQRQAYVQSLLNRGGQPGQQPQQGVPAPSNVPAYLQPNQPQPQAPQTAPGAPSTPPVAAPQPAPVAQNGGLSQDGQNYLSRQYSNYVRSTGGLAPDPKLVQTWVKQFADTEKPIGMTQAGVQLDAQGNPVGTKWSRVVRDNKGTVKILPPDNLLPLGKSPDGVPILDGLGNPVSPESAGQPPAKPGVVAANTPAAIPDTAERNTAIKDATDHLHLLNQNQAKIQELGGQVAAYIQKNPSTWRNAIMGTDLGLKIRAAHGDTTGQKMEQGLASNLNSIMDNMREGGKGSLGMRLTGSEWNQLKEAFPQTTQAPDVQIQGWKNIAVTNDYSRRYAENYLKNLQTMKPGEASVKANAETAKPDFAAMKLPAAPIVAPAAAVDYLKKHPTTAAHFDQKFGPGAAAQVLATK